MTAELYQQCPLRAPGSDIRLLTLLPGSEASPIKCTLAVLPLLLCSGQYEALSYHWHVRRGDRVSVNDVQIPVTANLRDALLHLRHPDKPRTIWIDAICINQEDIPEKNVQVGMMHDIYKNCSRVVAWLGLAAGGTMGTVGTEALEEFVQRLLCAKSAIENAQSMDSQIFTSDIWTSTFGVPHRTEAAKDSRMYSLSNEDCRNFGVPHRNNLGYDVLRHLLNSTWARRVWVIQEAAVAPDAIMQYGTYEFSMKNIALALSLVLGLGFFKQYPRHFGVVWTEHIDQKKGRRRPLLELVIRHWLAEATRGHDKIYALCGLASDAGPKDLNIKIRYERSVNAVYTDFARRVLLNYGNLDIFCALAAFTEKRCSLLPSWVPDWRDFKPGTLVYSRPLEGFRGPCNVLYKASGDSVADCQFSESSTRLQLSGMIIDSVEAVGPIHSDSHTSTAGLSYMLKWRGEIARLDKKKQYSLTGEKMLFAFYHTLTMGNLSAYVGDAEQEYSKFDDDLVTLGHQYFSRRAVPDGRALVRDTDVWDSKVYKACEVGIHRSLIRTKKGYLGLVHRAVRSGDSIALFKGGALPLVIRPRKDHWRMVGDGYVHGAMNSELFKEKKCKPFWFT